ncbi:acyl-CoA thioesterase [Janibacter cremeus]|uniref:Acyl-CoA thioesterase FadM n=1 Tax=Janibacter cremeus TaxID=1285192 RepID=A0A852VU88_9MICO|nr:acyl-CoA thioesterase [Janibacter cremeus]NYF97131.1 acyl-CoA thioesterase FadM [Janibacter cremeus]
MNRSLRIAWTLATAKRRGGVAPDQPATLRLRVLPNDIDLAGHMNNGVYFSMADLGRIDLMIRSGWGRALLRHRVSPVVMQETMTFRTSLAPMQAYELQSVIAGWDRVSVYCEQRFVVDDQVCAQTLVRMRFLHKGKGVDTERLWPLLGIDPPPSRTPDWAKGWGDGSRLPSPREDAPAGEPPFWA